ISSDYKYRAIRTNTASVLFTRPIWPFYCAWLSHRKPDFARWRKCMKAFHHKQPIDTAGNVHASSVTRTMKGQSLDTWDMFTRESLQNSWDARDRTSNEDGVTFAIDFNELGPEQVDTLRYEVFDDDVVGLEGLSRALDSGEIKLLSVSDSGTHGLRGPSIASAVTKDSSAPRDFDAFVRNIGRSDTKTLQGGTYGFGKGVFFIVSQV